MNVPLSEGNLQFNVLYNMGSYDIVIIHLLLLTMNLTYVIPYNFVKICQNLTNFEIMI